MKYFRLLVIVVSTLSLFACTSTHQASSTYATLESSAYLYGKHGPSSSKISLQSEDIFEKGTSTLFKVGSFTSVNTATPMLAVKILNPDQSIDIGALTNSGKPAARVTIPIADHWRKYLTVPGAEKALVAYSSVDEGDSWQSILVKASHQSKETSLKVHVDLAGTLKDQLIVLAAGKPLVLNTDDKLAEAKAKTYIPKNAFVDLSDLQHASTVSSLHFNWVLICDPNFSIFVQCDAPNPMNRILEKLYSAATWYRQIEGQRVADPNEFHFLRVPTISSDAIELYRRNAIRPADYQYAFVSDDLFEHGQWTEFDEANNFFAVAFIGSNALANNRNKATRNCRNEAAACYVPSTSSLVIKPNSLSPEEDINHEMFHAIQAMYFPSTLVPLTQVNAGVRWLAESTATYYTRLRFEGDAAHPHGYLPNKNLYGSSYPWNNGGFDPYLSTVFWNYLVGRNTPSKVLKTYQSIAAPNRLNLDEDHMGLTFVRDFGLSMDLLPNGGDQQGVNIFGHKLLKIYASIYRNPDFQNICDGNRVDLGVMMDERLNPSQEGAIEFELNHAASQCITLTNVPNLIRNRVACLDLTLDSDLNEPLPYGQLVFEKNSTMKVIADLDPHQRFSSMKLHANNMNVNGDERFMFTNTEGDEVWRMENAAPAKATLNIKYDFNYETCEVQHPIEPDYTGVEKRIFCYTQHRVHDANLSGTRCHAQRKQFEETCRDGTFWNNFDQHIECNSRGSCLDHADMNPELKELLLEAAASGGGSDGSTSKVVTDRANGEYLGYNKFSVSLIDNSVPFRGVLPRGDVGRNGHRCVDALPPL